MLLSPKYIIVLFALVTLGCKKDVIETNPLASLKIVNAVTGGMPVRLGSNVANVFNNQNLNFTVPTGNLDIYVWPIEDSLHPYYHGAKETYFEDRGVYTLFIGGTPDAVESVLIKENLPLRRDSIAGIRFINLSPESGPVNVTLASSPAVNEFSNVSFKQLTEFKSYPASFGNSSYLFEVRATVNPDLVLASFTLNNYTLGTQAFIPRFRNITLVFNGKITGSPAPRVRRVNHY